MGEYFVICNFDRKEALDPGVFGHGYKPGNFLHGALNKGVLHGLLHLLSLSGSIRGVQDRMSDPLFGRWAGQRIAIVGQYYEGLVSGITWEQDLQYWDVREGLDGWIDISEHVIRAIGGLLEDRSELPRSVLHPDGTVSALPYPWGVSPDSAD
jgi:hypothetical protein